MRCEARSGNARLTVAVQNRDFRTARFWYPSRLYFSTMSLFAVKPLDLILADSEGDSLKRSLRRHANWWRWDRRDHRRGLVFAHRTGRGAERGAGRGAQFYARGGRLRVRGPVLQRIRDHDSDRRQRLHLLLRDHGRADGVDHRLGPGAGVRSGRIDGGRELVRLRGQFPEGFRHRVPRSIGGLSV